MLDTDGRVRSAAAVPPCPEPSRNTNTTVNHHLGSPGFLHLPDTPDNRGMLDVSTRTPTAYGALEFTDPDHLIRTDHQAIAGSRTARLSSTGT
ncbi:hypothetical protein ACFQ6E_00370 [Streptomyces sp. NPDC056462]|uniref:hypothetical protein n=1 Tax=Streptomyces sp. NPDC056462 TaxID=3345826 RepID=UPI0036B3DF57